MGTSPKKSKDQDGQVRGTAVEEVPQAGEQGMPKDSATSRNRQQPTSHCNGDTLGRTPEGTSGLRNCSHGLWSLAKALSVSFLSLVSQLLFPYVTFGTYTVMITKTPTWRGKEVRQGGN